MIRPGKKSGHCPQIAFSSMPIQKTHSKQKLTTPESTQQEIFHSCFQRVGTFRMKSTQNYLRKALQFQAQIHGHLVYRLNKQPSTKNRKKSQVHKFGVCNQSNFLPMKRNPQNQTRPYKKRRNQHQTIGVFLKTPALTKTFHGNPEKNQSTLNKLNSSPPCQHRTSMSRSPHRHIYLDRLLYWWCFSTDRKSLNKMFCDWGHHVMASIPQLQKQRCHQILFRPHLYQIQCHAQKKKLFFFFSEKEF